MSLDNHISRATLFCRAVIRTSRVDEFAVRWYIDTRIVLVSSPSPRGLSTEGFTSDFFPIFSPRKAEKTHFFPVRDDFTLHWRRSYRQLIQKRLRTKVIHFECPWRSGGMPLTSTNLSKQFRDARISGSAHCLQTSYNFSRLRRSKKARKTE